MSENVNSLKSKSFMQREDWIVLWTGGLVSSGAIGWFMYRGFKSQQLDYKAIMAIAASFAGGMGIYFTSSALVCKCRKPKDSHSKSITSKRGASGPTALDSEINLCERFANVISDLDRRISLEEIKEKENKKNFWEAPESPCKSVDMTRRLKDFNRKELRKAVKLPIENQMGNCSDEGMRCRKTKFREDILSYINELKGYVQGAIDPLPSARNYQFRSSDMSDEMRRQVVVIVKEYANSMLPKLELIIDEFIDSVYVFGNLGVIDFDKEHKVKKALETLGVSEKDLSTALLKIEIDQFYKYRENATKSKSQMPFCENGQRSKKVLGDNMHHLQSASSSSVHEEKTCAQTSELSLPVMPELETPTTAGIPFMSKEAGLFAHLAGERPENPPVKLTLTEEQIHYFNLLKSEL